MGPAELQRFLETADMPQRAAIRADLEARPEAPLSATLNAVLESGAWVEQEYNRKHHEEIAEAPLTRFLRGPQGPYYDGTGTQTWVKTSLLVAERGRLLLEFPDCPIWPVFKDNPQLFQLIADLVRRSPILVGPGQGA